MGDKRRFTTGRSRSHKNRSRSILTEASLESLDERLQGQPRPGRERRSSSSGDRAGLRLSHVAFLLLGLAVGVGLYALYGLVVRLVNTRQPAPAVEPPAVLKPLPPPPAPRPRTLKSDDPTAIVRDMLRASLAGEAATAYAYWGIDPTEVAFTGPGLQVSLEEATSMAARHANRVKLDQCEFKVRKREGDLVYVGQYTRGVCTQIYTVKRTRGIWQIMNARLP